VDGEAPKNEAPKRIDLPVYTGKLHIFLVPWPEDGPGMYRFVERHDQIPRRDPPAAPEPAKSAPHENDGYLSTVLGASAAHGEGHTPEPQQDQRRGRHL
jgi:hypothetical protein